MNPVSEFRWSALQSGPVLQLFFLPLIALTLVVLLAGCVTVQKTEPQLSSEGVTELTDHVSDAGIPYSLAYVPDVNRVAVHVVWPNHWVQKDQLVVASVLGVDLMSSGGAGARSAKKVKQDISGLGSTASLASTPDHIYGTFTSTTETLTESLDIIRDVLTVPELSGPRFETLKEALQKRIAARDDKPSAVLWSAARASVLGESPLTDYWNNTPVRDVVAPLTLENIRHWRKETFVRKGMRVAIAGKIDVDAASKAVDQLLADLPSGSSRIELARPQPRSGFTVLLHDETATATSIAVVGRLPPSREGDEIADIIAVSALGKGKDSRIVTARKAELPDALPIDTSIANFSREIRVFGINTEASDEEAPAVLALIEKTYREFKQADLNDQDVLRAVVPFVNSLQNNTRRVDLLAYGLGQLLVDELPKEMLLTVSQDSLALKAVDINQRIVERYPDWEATIKVIMSRDDEVISADCVITRIEQLSSCDS